MKDKVERILNQNYLTAEDLCDSEEYQAIKEDEEVLNDEERDDQNE